MIDYYDLFNNVIKVEEAPPEELRYLSILNKRYNELAWSNILAFFLDPNENHGLGDTFLQCFGSLVGGEFDYDPKDITVEREVKMDNSIADLILYSSEWAILIENKVLSGEGEGQTNRLYDDFRQIPTKNYPEKRRYVLLTLKKEGPKNEVFQHLRYSKLLEKLDEQMVHIWVREASLKTFVFLSDFIDTIREGYTVSEKLEVSNNFRTYIKHYDKIEPLSKSYDEVIGKIREIWPAKVLESNSDFQYKNGRAIWQLIYKSNWFNPDVHFEFWLEPETFINERLCFMVDVERNNKEEFKSKFDKLYHDEKLEKEYGNIKYKSDRKEAIAYKEYPFTDPNEIIDTIKRAFDEFKFLEKYIDEVFKDPRFGNK